MEAEATLSDVHKLSKYRQQDYLKHREFKTEMDKRKAQVGLNSRIEVTLRNQSPF